MTTVCHPQRYEYYQDVLEYHRIRPKMIAMSKEGWKYISMTPIGTNFIVVFERPFLPEVKEL